MKRLFAPGAITCLLSLVVLATPRMLDAANPPRWSGPVPNRLYSPGTEWTHRVVLSSAGYRPAGIRHHHAV